MANATNFPESFRGPFAAIADTRNCHYSRANGWNTPKSTYRWARQRARESIEEI
jgi:hypothetical protein